MTDSPTAEEQAFQPPPPEDSRAAFAALDHAHQQRLAAEVGELVAIVHAADLYEVDQEAVLDGMERLVQPGHDGTPLVGEFLATEIGPLLGISPDAAMGRIGDALDLRHRLPKLWNTVLAGTVQVWQALKVCQATAALSAQAAGWVDKQLADALQAWPWPRVTRALPAWIIQADPDTARQRAETAARDHHLRLSGINDGHIAIWGLVDAADGIDFDQAINQIANSLPNDPTAAGGSDLDARRAAAVGILARSAFGQNVLPSHTLVVHIAADDPAINTNGQAHAGQAGTGVAHVDKWGPLLTEQLPRFLAGSKVIVRPIIDPATIGAVDAHDPTAVMRFAVEQRNPVDVFPYGTRAATNCDLDHTTPYTPGEVGQTHLGNLGPLSRFTHRAKTFGGWQLQQPEPGVFHWTSPAGYQYLVTADGTTRIHMPEAEAETEGVSNSAEANAEPAEVGAETETDPPAQAEQPTESEPPTQAELPDQPEPLDEAS